MESNRGVQKIGRPVWGMLAVLVAASGIEAYGTRINSAKPGEQAVSEILDNARAIRAQPKPETFTGEEWDGFLYFDVLPSTFLAEAHVALIEAMEQYTIRNPRLAGMPLEEYRKIRQETAFEEIYGPTGGFNPEDGSRR